MHSAAGIAAAAAAIHSSSSAVDSAVNANVLGVASTSHTTSLSQNVVLKENKYRGGDAGKSGIEATSEENHMLKDMTSNLLPESSSDVVSSTMDDEEENVETNEVSDANRHEERRRTVKNKVK